MIITTKQLETAAKAAATSEYDGRNWRDYIRATRAAFATIGVTCEDSSESLDTED